MARPRLQEHEKRTERHNLRFTLAEIDHIRSQADAAGLDVSEYLRRRALGYTVPAGGASRRTDPALISELNRVGVNVNQLALATHTGREFVRYWQEIGREVEQVLEQLVDHEIDQEAGEP
jgi:hypothetical protein